MPPHPSTSYQRLREFFAERMRMSQISQPLMLMELLGHGSAWNNQPRPGAGRGPANPGQHMVGKVLTGNGNTATSIGSTTLIGGLPGLMGWADRPGAVSESKADRVDSRGWRRCRYLPPPPSSRARMGIF